MSRTTHHRAQAHRKWLKRIEAIESGLELKSSKGLEESEAIRLGWEELLCSEPEVEVAYDPDPIPTGAIGSRVRLGSRSRKRKSHFLFR